MRVKEASMSIKVEASNEIAIKELLEKSENEIEYLKKHRNKIVELVEKFNTNTPEIIQNLKQLNSKIIKLELSLAAFRNTYLDNSQ